MKLGCNTSLFNNLDLYDALQYIAWAGFDGAELSRIKAAKHLELNMDQAYVDEVKLISKKQGLELFAIQAEEEGQTDEDNIKSMTKLLDVARKLNIPIVNPFIRKKPGDKEVTKQNFKYIRKLCEQAESRGITLAIPIYADTPVDNTATAIQMLDEIDSPALGITLDTREIYRIGEDPSETISKIGKKIVHVHLRDYPRRQQSAATPEQQIPGRGEIDFLKILRCLKDVGYDKAIDVMLMGIMAYPLIQQKSAGGMVMNAWTYPEWRQMGMAAEARGYLNRCFQELK